MPRTMTQTRPRSFSANADFAPIFIVGHPRSGTTMLARLFDRHSQLAVHTETFFFAPAHRHRLRAAERAGTHAAFLELSSGHRASSDIQSESVAERFARGLGDRL